LQCQGRASVSGLPGSSSVAHTPPRGKGAAVTVIKFRKLHGPPMKRALIGSLATASAEAKPDPDQTPRPESFSSSRALRTTRMMSIITFR
jgi:hypothetical protein